MDNLLTVKIKSDLYGLQNISVDQLVYVSKDNIIYHLRDISRKNKKDGWEATGAVPVNVSNTTLAGAYLTELEANTKYVKLQSSYISDPTSAPYQQMYGDLYTSGDLVAYRSSSPTGSFWDNMPRATTTGIFGAVTIGTNLSIDINGVLNAAGGAGSTDWGLIGGDIADQTDLGIALGLKADTSHPLVHANHSASGLTAGHFLKATAATTYGFAAHGLTYIDVNAISKSASASTDRQILTWDGTSGALVRVSTGVSIDSASTVLAGGDVVAYQASGYTSGVWDTVPVDDITLKYSPATSGIISIKPAITGNANKYLMVSASGTAIEWASAATVNMTWPSGAGIALYSGSSSWSGSITNNSANWNTAYGWGNHASAGYALIASPALIGIVTIGDYSNTAIGLTFKGNLANTQSILWEAEDASDRFTQYANLDATTDNDLLVYRSLSYDNQLVLKGNGNSAFGSSSPLGKLQIAGGDKSLWITYNSSNEYRARIWGQWPTAPSTRLSFGISAGLTDTPSELMNIYASGMIKIGTGTPAHELDVTGTIVASADVIAYHS